METYPRILDVAPPGRPASAMVFYRAGRSRRAREARRWRALGYDADELQMERFRNATPGELLPRWTKLFKSATGSRMKVRGTPRCQSEQQREFQQSIVKGEVESADASPAAPRGRGGALADPQGAANTRNSRTAASCSGRTSSGDGRRGFRGKVAHMALLANLENEVAGLPRAAARGRPGARGRARDRGGIRFAGLEWASRSSIVAQTSTGGGGVAGGGSSTGSRRSSGVTVEKKWCKRALNLYHHRKGPQIRRRGASLGRAGVIA